MAQQVNLYNAVRAAPGRSRWVPSSTTAVLVLALVLCVSLFQVTLWNKKSTALEKTLSRQTAELQSRKAQRDSLQKLSKGTRALAPDQLKLQQATLAQRAQLLEDLRADRYPAGWRYSDRLEWVAQSIPAQVWIDHLSVDAVRFELGGFTLETADISQWMARLAANPAMSGLRLETAEIANVPAASVPAQQAVWSFRLVNAWAPIPRVVSKDTP